MNIRKIFLSGSFATLASLSAFAQKQQQTTAKDTLLKGQTIQITQIYQPKIEKPVKPVLTPTLPPPDTTTPHFQYVVPQQTLSYTYHSVPIRPLALGKIVEPLPFQNYAKIGAGNLSSLYFDAGIGSIKGKNYQTAFHLSHLNQKGKLANQKASWTRFDGSGQYAAAHQIFEADLSVRNRSNRFYGYNNENYIYPDNDLKHRLTDGSLTLSMKNASANSLSINYHPEITFGTFGDNNQAKENRISFNLPVEWNVFGNFSDSAVDQHIVSGKASLGIFGNFVSLRNPLSSTNNNLFKINPALDFSYANLLFHIGLSPSFGDSKFYLLPDLSLQTKLHNNDIKLNAGWKADIIQNTYLELSLYNPFLNNQFSPVQTKSNQVFAGIETTLSKFVTLGGTISWRSWDNLALFVNDYAASPDGKEFQVIYRPKTQALNLEASVRYQPSEIIALSFKGSWYSFYNTTADKIWGYPAVQLDGLVEFHPIKKLFAHAGITYMNGIYELQANGKTKELPGIVDLNAAAEYSIIPRLSVFLQANNLLNNQYERWNQYPVFGINIIGGIRFKF